MIIQNNRQLAEFCESISSAEALFIDTEFIGEGRYYPSLGAIQVSLNSEMAVLIDPLTVTDFQPLSDLLTNDESVKVFHAASQDLMILNRLFGKPVQNVFDTQVAYAMISDEEQISFANLVDRTTGIKLAKSHGYSDWLRRPLSKGQIEYALDDVKYLALAYDVITNDLRKKDRLNWAEEEFSELSLPQKYAELDPMEVYVKFKNSDRMPISILSAIRELAAYRETMARQLNIPVSRIARDEVIQEIARRPNMTLREMREIRGISQQTVNDHGIELLKAAQSGVNNPVSRVKRNSYLPTSLEPTVDFLVLCLRSIASELSIASGLCATRSDLAMLVQYGTEADIPLMRGWRKKAIGDTLLATLQGKATVKIINDSKKVHIDWH